METLLKRPNNWLGQYRKKVTSQFGEEGVFEEIFRVIRNNTNYNNKETWCVEFGAGRANSNTRSLINHRGWFGVLIEANPIYYRNLLNLYKDNKRVGCFNRIVNFEGPNTLDNILRKTKIPLSFDLLIIDIDGNDYHIWKSIEIYKPNVVMVEYNKRIPLDIEFIQPRDINLQWGSSLASIVKLGKEKGYELVYAYACNAIFVKKESFIFFNIKDNSLMELMEDCSPKTHFFQLYDGTIVLYGFDRLLAHKKKIYRKPVYMLTSRGLFPLEFTYDKIILRTIKNFVKSTSLYAFTYPLAERFYGKIWRKKKKKLTKTVYDLKIPS